MVTIYHNSFTVFYHILCEQELIT